jgi:hypothetical protein
MLDTPCSEVVWRVLATHYIRQFPLHFPSRASPCVITFQLDSTEEWRKLHNEKLSDLYCSSNIVRVIKSRRMRWTGHVARMWERRGAYRVMVGKPEGKRSRERPRRRWKASPACPADKVNEYEYRSMVKWYWHRKIEILGEETLPVSLSPPQTSHGLSPGVEPELPRWEPSRTHGQNSSTWYSHQQFVESSWNVTKRLLLVMKIPHSNNLSPHTSYCNSATGFACILEANSITVPQVGPWLRNSMCFHFTIAYCSAIRHNVIFTEKYR